MRSAAVVALSLFVMLAHLPRSASGDEAVPRRNVLVLFSHQRTLPVNVVLDNLFRAQFGASAPDIEYMAEFVESTRFTEGTYEPHLSQYLAEKYQHRYPEVLITVGPDALDFVLDQRHQLFPEVPVVFAFVREVDIQQRQLPADVTGAFTSNETLHTLELALRLQPETERVVVVGTRYSEFDQRYLDEARRELQPFEDRLAIEYWDDLTLEEARQGVAQLGWGTVVLYVALTKDRAGLELFPSETLDQLADVASVPIYSVGDDWYVGRGAVAGRFTPLTAIGSEAALRAEQVLNREATEPPQQLPLSTAVDWRQFQRWQLSDRRLPAEAEIRFREPTLWQQYRLQIMGVLGLFVLQSVLIAGLLVQRGRRRRAQRDLEESQDRVSMILEAAHLGVAFWNFRTGQHTCNLRFRQLLRLEACTLCLQAEIVRHVHPSDRELVKLAIDRALAERSRFDLEFRVVDAPG